MTDPNKSDPKREAEDLLERMKLRDEAQAKHEPEGVIGKINDMATFARRANKVWDAAQVLFDKVKPVAALLFAPAKWAFGHLKEIWDYNAYKHDGNGKMKLDAQGDPIFDPGRLMRTFATAAILGNMAVIGGAGLMFHLTDNTVYSYVTNKQMKIPGELYEVTGAESLPTSTELDNGMYYHVKNSLFYPAQWRPEEDVYALIPQGDAVCKWENHGIYVKGLKWLHKQAEFYQYIYDSTCYPLSEQMIGQIVRDGILPEAMFNELATSGTMTAPATPITQEQPAPGPVEQYTSNAYQAPTQAIIPVVTFQPGLG